MCVCVFLFWWSPQIWFFFCGEFFFFGWFKLEIEKKKKIRGSTCDDRWWGNKNKTRKNKWDNDNKPDQSLSFSDFQAVDLITLDTGTYSLSVFLSLSISSIFQWNNDVERERDAHTENTQLQYHWDIDNGEAHRAQEQTSEVFTKTSIIRKWSGVSRFRPFLLGRK